MQLDDNDKLLIAAAVAKGGDVWNDESLADIKLKIKNHYMQPDDGCCCYCRESFQAVHRMTIDLEHILPKSIFNDFIFELFNLNVSCKRCNMSIKKNRTDFLVDAATIHFNPQKTDQYRFIHPNLDVYKDHLKHIAYTVDDQRLVKYIPLKPKGKYTYDFFRLQEKEIDSFNQAQGIEDSETEELLPNQPTAIQQQTEILIKQL